jgi:beta-phosphoglucomutase
MLGVLFDFDGTLADTMPNHFKAWKATLNKHGIKINQHEYYPLEGMSMHSIAKILTKSISFTDEEISKLVLDKKNYYKALTVSPLYEGVEYLIKQLNLKEIPIGIVTSSHYDQIFSKFSTAFLSQFQAIITGDQVQHGKPHPQPYLIGAKILGLNPKRCIAVENAPLGVSSAKSAGMYCIGVSSTVLPSQLSEANKIINNIRDIELTTAFKELYKSYE